MIKTRTIRAKIWFSAMNGSRKSFCSGHSLSTYKVIYYEIPSNSLPQIWWNGYFFSGRRRTHKWTSMCSDKNIKYQLLFSEIAPEKKDKEEYIIWYSIILEIIFYNMSKRSVYILKGVSKFDFSVGT